MPSFPVFLNILGKIRPAEVLCYSNSHGLGNTYGNVNASGEVCVQFKGIEHHTYKYKSALIDIRILNNLIYRHQNTVGNNHLLKISPQDTVKSIGYYLCVKGMFLKKRFCQVIKPADRTLDQLREKGYEQGQLKQIPLCLAGASVNVDDISHGLKGIEGNSHWQDQVYKGKFPCTVEGLQDPVDIGNDKIGIFQHCQDPQIENKTDQKPFPLFSLHLCFIGFLLILGDLSLICFYVGVLLRPDAFQLPAHQIGRYRSCRDKDQIRRTGDKIKYVAGDQQQRPLTFLRQHIIQDKHRRDKSDETI